MTNSCVSRVKSTSECVVQKPKVDHVHNFETCETLYVFVTHLDNHQKKALTLSTNSTMSSSNPFAVLATLDDDDDEREEKQSTFTFAPSVLGPVEGRLGGGGAGGGAGARSVTAAAAPFALAAAAPTLPAGGAGHGTFTDLVKQHAQSSPLPLAGPTNAPPPTPEPASPATQARLAPPVAFDAALLSQACSQISVPSRTSDKSWDFAGLAHDVS